MSGCLIAFGSIWLTTVFPGFKNIPSDYEQTIDFQGKYALVSDQPFLQQLLTNASVQRLAANPSSLKKLAEPAAQRLLVSGDLQGLLADPALLQQVLSNLPRLTQASTPDIREALSNPSFQRLVNDPAALQLLRDPQVQKVLADPAAALRSTDPAAKQILSDPLIQRLMADPATAQALASPAAKQLLADPTLVGLITNPAVQKLLANPSVPTLLADPVVQGLLADKAALGLLADPRTLRLLAQPSQLPLAELPINLHRVRRAQRGDGDVLLIHQDFVATVLGTGQPLDQFSSQATLAVNRKTRQYTPGGSEPRQGAFSFPFDVRKEREYALWVHEVFQPIPTTFLRTEEIDGLRVYVFESKVERVPLPAEPKKNLGVGGKLELVASVNLLTWTEPKTGITVKAESHIAYKLDNPALGDPVVFDGNIIYSDSSISTALSDARDARGRLFWFGLFLPWACMGVGIFLVLVSATVVGLGRRRRSTLWPFHSERS